MSEPQLAPVATADRIAHLDVLRGLAILGILLVNAIVFAMPFAVSSLPDASPIPFEGAAVPVWWVTRTFFEMKFITLFSMLFGVSIFLVGGEWGRADRAAVLRRRLFWLGLIGLLHGAVIWYGDVLLHYALVGALMSQFRSWGPRRLIIVGLVLFALSGLMTLGAGFALAAAPADLQQAGLERFSPQAVRELIARFGSDDLLTVQGANLSVWAENQIGVTLFWGPRTLGLMMIGLALFKSGLLVGRASVRTYVVLALLGALSLAAIGMAAWAEYEAGFPPQEAAGKAAAPNFLLSPVATLGYVALLNLALRGGLARRAALALAPVGRMAFTNYLTQSLIMTAIFYGGGRGLGLFGSLDWEQWALIVVGVWILQLVWSPIWLSRFSMGPLEWAWRRLSYGRAIPLRGALERPAVPAG